MGYFGSVATGPNEARAMTRQLINPTFPRSAAWERRNPVRVLPI